VEAGCIWKTLEQELGNEDLCLRCYPSSAPLGTVGGWMSTGGYGIGTHREGRFHKQVASMEVALASGLLVTSSQGEGRYSIGSFAGTEGQVGVITKLTLPVKVTPERRACYLVRLRKEEEGFELLKQLADSDDPPFFTQLVSGGRSRLLHERAGFPTGEGGFISVVEEGDAQRINRFDQSIKRMAQAGGLDLDDGEDAASVWKKRYSYLELVSTGAIVLAGEIVIDSERAPALAGAITRTTPKGPTPLYECQLVDRGRALVAVGIRGDEGSASGLTRDVRATSYIMDLGVRAGGRPYGIGLWNSAYSRRILGKNYKNLRLVKTEIDRLGLLNPGKLFSMTTNRGFPVPGWIYRSAVRIAARF
jgi:glycolate oxidase